MDELTLRRLNIVDSTGAVRVILAGEFPPRRGELAGLLFLNEEGNEAGGLVYHGRRDSTGAATAGGILTFDQFQNDQVMALQYAQRGERKTTGMTISDRPDTLPDIVKRAYRELDHEPPGAKRDSLLAWYRDNVPQSAFSSRRLFVGRAPNGDAVLTLADAEGRDRLRIAVDSTGSPSITFLDEGGRAVRTLSP